MLPLKHSAMLSTFIKLPFVIKIFVLSIFEGPFYTGFTVYLHYILVPGQVIRNFYQLLLNAGQKYCRMLCNTSTFLKLPFVIKFFVLSGIFEGLFYTGFTVYKQFILVPGQVIRNFLLVLNGIRPGRTSQACSST